MCLKKFIKIVDQYTGLLLQFEEILKKTAVAYHVRDVYDGNIFYHKSLFYTVLQFFLNFFKVQ